MGRTACTEPQCLYKGALYLIENPSIQEFIVCSQYIMTFFYVVSGEGECLEFVNTIIKCTMIF